MATPEPIKIANKILKDFFCVDNPLHDLRNGSWELRKNFTESYITSDIKGQYVIWSFPVKATLYNKFARYPFYIAFKMSLAGNYDIHNVNIKVFKKDDNATGGIDFFPTELLLRAEWSNDGCDDDESDVHAQPHWHIHSYKVIDFFSNVNADDRNILVQLKEASMESKSLLAAEFDGETETKEKVLENEVPLFKFHLSMLANWDIEQDNKSHYKVLNCHSLKLWLPQCLSYVKYQLEYILEKLP